MPGMSDNLEDCVFLDLDGCLVDSSAAIPNAMNAALGDLGLPAVPVKAIHRLIGPPLESFAAQLMERVGGTPDQVGPFAEAYLAHYAARMVEDSKVYEGIPEALTALASGSRLAVVTLKRQELARRLLTELALARFFDFVVGAQGTETDKVPLLTLAVELARPRRAVMVGDQPDDMSAAIRVAIPPIGVTWGFGSDDALITAGAAAIVDRPSDLEAAISSVW
jgi:phosphoglycolate phosphatase